MATQVWRGGAAAVAQVQNYTFGGTWEADDLIRCTIGTKSTDIVAGSTVITTVVDNVVTAWNALSATSYPEFAEITASRSGNDLLLTADTAGVPFTVTLTPLETGGGAADAQTIEGGGVATTGAVTTASSGPNDWSTAANWTSAVPVAADTVIVENSAVPIYYGLAQSAVTITSLTVRKSFTGTIGLPRTNASDYVEYRDTYLAIGVTTGTLGNGEGDGSGRIKINTGSVQTALTVLGSGAELEEGLGSIIWKGTHASNAVTVNRGSVSIAPFGGEVATVLTLKIGQHDSPETDATVRSGSGVTLGTVTKNGGTLICDNTTAAITALTQTVGETTIDGSTNAVTALNVYGGTVRYNTAGTLTACTVVSGAVLDFRRDMRAKTVSAITAYAGAAIHDPAAVVTWTTGIDLVGCGLEDVTLQIGKHRTWTPTAI